MYRKARGMWDLNFSSDDDDDEGNGEDVAPPEHAATQRHKDASPLVHKAAADRHAAQPQVTTREHQGADAQHEAVTAFHDWGMVHAGTLDNERQLQHTFVISRAQRRRALKAIPGLADIVSATQAEIESLRLHDTPTKLEWLTGHILNQGDVNARFEYHQDTDEERKEVGGRRDRRVLYTAIVKLNSGGCTSMQVYGHPEVFYYAHGGCSVIFRSDLHHRTEKAEPGIWKLALFFGLFL